MPSGFRFARPDMQCAGWFVHGVLEPHYHKATRGGHFRTFPSPLMPPKASRSWWRNEFYDHPGRAEKRDDAYVVATGGTTKVEKVYCKPCFDADIAEIIARDELDLGLGRRNDVRSRDEITTRRTLHLVLSIHP
jgi:hypothetical protein